MRSRPRVMIVRLRFLVLFGLLSVVLRSYVHFYACAGRAACGQVPPVISSRQQPVAQRPDVASDIMQALTATHCRFCGTTAFAQQRPRAVQCLRTRNPAIRAAATKASDFRRLTTEEIDQQVQDAKRELMLDFRVPSRTAGQGQQKKPKLQIKWDAEKKIAQLLTVRREQELDQKINKRESRRLQRMKNVDAGFNKIR